MHICICICVNVYKSFQTTEPTRSPPIRIATSEINENRPTTFSKGHHLYWDLSHVHASMKRGVASKGSQNTARGWYFWCFSRRQPPEAGSSGVTRMHVYLGGNPHLPTSA